jgi:transposase-like protein
VLSVLSGLFFIATAFFGSLETWFIFRQLTAKIGQFNARLFPEIKKREKILNIKQTNKSIKNLIYLNLNTETKIGRAHV